MNTQLLQRFSGTDVLRDKLPAAATSRRGERVVLVGSGAGAREASITLAARGSSVVLLGRVSETEAEADQADEWPALLGSVAELKEIILSYDVSKLVLVLPFSERHAIDPIYSAARELGIEVSVYHALPDQPTNIKQGKRGCLTFDLLRHPATRFPGNAVKRLIDLVGACLALAVFSPVMALAAIAVKLTSAGPVFFRQPRVGRGRRVFQMIKFRTMVADAELRRQELEQRNEARGVLFKIIDDPRLTRVGRFLRNTSIDELPQLFNVLLGDMSMVGPRPLPTWIAEQFQDTRYFRRYTVLPGMTGLWQVNGRRQDFEFMAERDIEYVDSWSVWFDLVLLAKTGPAVIRGDGAH